MKNIKFYKVIFLLTPFVSLIPLTSCNGSKTTSTYEQFISDRTFSIGCGCDELHIGDEHILLFGTGWILKDATPSNNTDYSYYMATNCHVCEYMFNYSSSSGGTDSSYHFLFDDYFEYTDADNLNYNYTEIEHGTGKFALYPGSTTSIPYTGFPTSDYKTAYTTTNENDASSSIDFRILKVDFGTPATGVLQKLNRVNKYCNENNSWAVTFASQYSGENCYIGGYPHHDNKPKWEFHDVKWYFGVSSHFAEHDIPGTANYTCPTGKYCDYSPQVFLQSVPSTADWMGGGASGSMCINNNYEVIGIYWGGWVYSGGNVFLPTLSVINDATYKDFTSLVP